MNCASARSNPSFANLVCPGVSSKLERVPSRRRLCLEEIATRLTVVVHEAGEGGLWAEVAAIPGRATEGDTFEELLTDLHEAIQGCLSVDVAHVKTGARDRVMDIAICGQRPGAF